MTMPDTKVYREPSKKLGPHASKMLGMDAKQRAAYKAQAFGALKTPGAWEDRGVRFEITDGPRERNGLLEVSVKARRVSDNVPMPLSNPLRFHNPPVKVPDGTWHKERDEASGEEIDAENFTEDLDAALRQMVADTAFAVWGREG